MRTLTVILLLTLAGPVPAATAVFAGGCFWCVEAAYQGVDGVNDAVSGFTGGTLDNPTYSGNHQGHYESVRVTYDPDTIAYETLLEIFWHNIDPFDDGGQFCDRGHSYLSAIFVEDDEQRALAETSKRAVQAQFPDRQVVTPILPAGRFWPVEEGHQDYYLKNPFRYKFYRAGCGRDRRLEEIWGESAGH